MRYPKRMKKLFSREEDRITHLPTEIKEKILTYLPVKDAVKTCLLSSKWRYTWTSIPELDLTDEDFSKKINRSEDLIQFTNFGDCFLSAHSGSIHKIKISCRSNISTPLERWLTILSRKKGIQEFDLRLTDPKRSYLPESFYEFHALNRLNLHGCIIILREKIEGFKFLNRLKIKNCIIPETNIQELVSHCPNLKYFSFKHYIDISSLKIFSPNLEQLGIQCVFKNLQLETPNLKRFKISNPSSSEGLKNCSVNNALASLKGIKELGIDCDYLQCMADSLNSMRNYVFEHLRKLAIFIYFKSQKTVFDFRLLQNAPHLQILHIWLRYSSKPDGTVLELDSTKEILLKNLSTIVIHGSVESESVLSFLQFILIKSPVLKTVLLLKNDPLILQKLIQSEKVSKNAKLVVKKVRCSSSCSSFNPDFEYPSSNY
ncbi:hypothetical protein LUZ60_003961 [Juncus effusus]|nr:hypothetical protein LUZ60_003961 [Juncus effusus]